MTELEPSKTIAMQKWKWMDGLFLAFLFGFTALFTLERLQWDYPDVFLGGDAANIVSFALAKNHPEWFAKDFLLSERQNFDIYLQFHVLYTQWLEKLFGDAILGFLSLLPITVLIYLGGLYFLGRTFFEYPGLALAFTAINALPIYLPVDDIGIQTDPLPRTLFHGILSFLLAYLWKWRDEPKRWWLLAVGLGGLVYIHAVSTPAWILAFWFSFLYLMPREWNLTKRLKWMAGLSLVLLIAVIPFVQNYLHNTVQVRTLPKGISYASFIEIFRSYYGSPDLHNVLETTLTTLLILSKTGVLPLGVLGFIFGVSQDTYQRKKMILIIIWFLIITFTSIIIPHIESIIEHRLQILPLQMELVRGLRFLRFLFSFSFFLGIKPVYEKSGKSYLNLLLFSLFCVFITIIIYNNSQTLELIQFSKTRSCITEKQRFYCGKPSSFREVILFLREGTPINAAIFFAPKPTDTSALAVRYMAHRSLVYSWKDRGLGFTQPEKLLDWYKIYLELKGNKNPRRWLSQNPSLFLKFLADIGVDYYVMSGSCVPQTEPLHPYRIRLIYQNADYSVCRLD